MLQQVRDTQLEQARSNVDGQSGRTIYEESVLPFMAGAQPA